MCFKSPKAPKVEPEDPVLKRQVAQATAEERLRRTAAKEARLEDTLTLQDGGYGRRSLLSGGRGGGGFAALPLRSLFVKG